MKENNANVSRARAKRCPNNWCRYELRRPGRSLGSIYFVCLRCGHSKLIKARESAMIRDLDMVFEEKAHVRYAPEGMLEPKISV